MKDVCFPGISCCFRNFILNQIVFSELADTKTAKHHDVEESSMYEIPLYDSETPTIEKPVFVSSGKRLEADNSTHSNRVETIVVDETTIESEHTDESFPEPPPVPAQEVELAKTDNEENGNVSKGNIYRLSFLSSDFSISQNPLSTRTMM